MAEAVRKEIESNAITLKQNTGQEVSDVLDQSIRRCPNTEDIFLLCEQHAEKLNHINIPTAMSRFAKMFGCFSEIRPKHQPGLTLIQEQTCKLIFNCAVSNADRFDSQGLSTLMWALASLNMPSADLQEGMGVISQRVIATASSFKPLDLADLMWGLATLELPAERLLVQAVTDRSVRVIDEFNARQLSRLMWAIAKLKVEPCIKLAQAVSRRATETIRDFKPAHMAQLMWAYAKMEYFPGNELALAILEHANLNLDGFSRQCHTSSNFLWAIDQLGIKADPQLVDALSGRQSVSAPESQSRRTYPEPELSRAPEQTLTAENRFFVNEIPPSEQQGKVYGTECILDKSLGPGYEPVALSVKSNASSVQSCNALKRKRDDEDESTSAVKGYYSLNSEGRVSKPTQLIQKCQVGENQEVADVEADRYLPEDPDDAGDFC